MNYKKIIIAILSVFILIQTSAYADSFSERFSQMRREYEEMKSYVESEMAEITGEISEPETDELYVMPKPEPGAPIELITETFLNNTVYGIKHSNDNVKAYFKSFDGAENEIKTVDKLRAVSTQAGEAYAQNKDNPSKEIYILLLSALIVCAAAVAMTVKKRGQYTAMNRVNGKRSLFDFTDIKYDFTNDFNSFNFNDAELQNQQFMQNEMMRQSAEFAMNEAMKAVTPFDHGGYVQGYGFNPSDTMAGDMTTQMNNDMIHMNDMNMF